MSQQIKVPHASAGFESWSHDDPVGKDPYLDFLKSTMGLVGMGIVLTVVISLPLSAKDEGETGSRPGVQSQLNSPLNRKVTLNYENTPLGDVLESLCKSAGVKLELDEDRLISAGYSKESPVTMKTERVTFEEALTRVLKSFDRISFTLDQDELFVSSQQRVKARANARLKEARPFGTPSRQVKTDDDEKPRQIYTHPIQVTGRALDVDGNPVSGARIFIASVRADYKRLAETSTDEDGRYEFHDVPLPIEPVQKNGAGKDHGGFEVFGAADGQAFAWVPVTFFSKGNTNDWTFVTFGGAAKVFLPGDPIVRDLVFHKPQAIKGRIVDERGVPISGVRLALRRCEELQADDRIEQGIMNSKSEFSALNQSDDVPAEIKIRVTDPDGRFEFQGLPPECQFWLEVRHADYARRNLYAATTRRILPKLGGKWSIHTDDIELTFVRIREISMRIIFDDSGLPAEKVLVSAANNENHDGKETDQAGQVILKLPPGRYSLELLPARGTSYLVTKMENGLVVADMPNAEPIVKRLKAGCTLDVTIIDAETGMPVSGVDLWMSDANAKPGADRREVMFRSWEKPIAWVERPTSNQEGELRAIIEPGDYRFGAIFQHHPARYLPVGNGQVFNCQPGRVVDATFKLRRIPKPDDNVVLDQQLPAEAVADGGSKADSLLERVFERTADEETVFEVLSDIGAMLGVKLEIDHATIWAGGLNDDYRLYKVSLMNLFEVFQNLAAVPNVPDWLQSALKREDGQILVSEALTAILEPLALDYELSGNVLLISTIDQIELRSIDKGRNWNPGPKSNDDGLRTRIVTQGFHPIGKPVELKVELRNFSEKDRYYDPRSVLPERSIHVIGPDAKRIEYRGELLKISNTQSLIKPGETIVLFKIDDLKEAFDLSLLGKYTLQFRVKSAENDVISPRPNKDDLSSLTDSEPIRIEIREMAGE